MGKVYEDDHIPDISKYEDMTEEELDKEIERIKEEDRKAKADK